MRRSRSKGLPVIEDLAAHDVAPDAPAVGVPLLAEPVVAQHLGVKVVRLERRVVDVHLGALEEEEAVVVDQVVAAVQAEEDGDVDLFVVVDELMRGKSSSQPAGVARGSRGAVARTSLGWKLK